MVISPRILRVLCAAMLSVAATAQADLIMTAPPRGTPEQDEKVFGPIAKYLSEKTGQNVIYAHQESWELYALAMREDKFDIVFDGPHFAAWRIKHLQHEALVRIPGTLGFIVATRVDRQDINTLKDMRKKKTCGLGSPNLGMLVFLAQFDIVQPPVEELTGNMPAVYQAFKNGVCDAMLLRDQFFFKKISEKERAGLKVVFTSTSMPNQTITVSKRVGPELRQLLRSSLLDTQGVAASQNLMTQYSKENPSFLAAETGSYLGIEKLLEGVLWGW